MRKRSNINFTLLMGILMLSGCFGRAFALVVSMHPCHYSAVQGKTLRRHWDSTARQTIADKRWHMLMLRQHHPKTLGLGIRMRQDETGRQEFWDSCCEPALCASFHIAQELWHLSRIAKGAALSGTLGRHQIYSHSLWQRLCAILRLRHFQQGSKPSEHVWTSSTSFNFEHVEICGNILWKDVESSHLLQQQDFGYCYQ